MKYGNAKYMWEIKYVILCIILGEWNFLRNPRITNFVTVKLYFLSTLYR